MREKLNIAVFLFSLALLFVFVFMLPADEGASEFENRSLAERPSLSLAALQDGSYFEDLEVYFSDATAYRTTLLQFAADVEQLYGFGSSRGATLVDISGGDLGLGLMPEVDDEDLYIAMPSPADVSQPAHTDDVPPPGIAAPNPVGDMPQPGGITGESSAGEAGAGEADTGSGDSDATQTPDPAGSTGQQDQPPATMPGGNPAGAPGGSRGGHVDLSGPFSVDIHHNENAILYERYRQSTRAARRYAEILNAYMSRVPEHVRVFSMLAPIRVEFMGERYAASNDSQLETINLIGGLLDERIIQTATYERLAAHSDEYVYFRTDHHWTALGAYYAYLSFADAAGFAPIGLDMYIEHAIPNFLGSYGRGTSNRTVREHPDTLYYYELDDGTTFTRQLFVIPQDMSRLSYRVFMGGDYARLDFNSSNQNGRTIVVVKDSFANALIPWLAPHYERIIVIDPRQFGGSVIRLLGELEDADLLFMNYVAATAMAEFIEMIYGVR